MENLKIRVKTEQESKEAQELFFALGFEWMGANDKSFSPKFIIIKNRGMFHIDENHIFDGINHKEITLSELRDMVVLTRNDPKDATHKCLWDVNPEYYTDSKGSVYFYKKELDASRWVKTVNSKDWCDKSLKPIKEEVMKESLNDKVASAEVARQKHSHYKKDVSHLKTIDVYRVLDLFDVESNAVGHAIKKLLCSGQRGAKDHKQDIREAIDSLNRHLEMLAEDEAS